MKNYFIKSGLLLFIFLMFFSSCSNKEKYTLEYNFNKDDSFRQHMTVQTNVMQNQNGKDMNITSLMQVNLLFTLVEADKDTYTMEVIYEFISMEMDLNGTKIFLKSNTENDIATPMHMDPLFKSMIGIPVKLVTDKKGNMQSVSGFDKIMESMMSSVQEDVDTSVKDQMFAVIKQQASEEALKSMFDNMFSYFPEKDVAIGDSWTINKKASASNGVNVNMSSVLNLTLKDVENGTAILVCNGTLSTPKEGIDSETMGMSTNTILNGTQEGTILIDMGTGITTNMNIVQNFEGKTTVGELEVPQTFVNKIKVHY